MEESDKPKTETPEKFNMNNILQNMGDAFVNLNREWRYTFVNNKALTLMEKAEDELLGKILWDIFPDIRGTIFEKEYKKVMEENISTSFETYYPSYDMWIEVRAYPHENGIAIFYTNITHHKKAEEEIRSFNKILEQKIKERTHELETANKELESFSYSISHDLQAPLRVISGYMHILLSEYGAGLDQEAIRLTEVIMNNARMMEQLIRDLLEFSHLGRKELEKTITPMHQLVQSVWEDLKPRTEERITELTLKPLPPINSDDVTIRQVWANLISNALKYSRYKASTVVEIGAEENDREIIYHIKDNGAGFHMNYYHKLFSVFQRLHSQSEFEGTGVGLAIVQRIIEKHGGKIWAEAQPGMGACFYFSLPK